MLPYKAACLRAYTHRQAYKASGFREVSEGGGIKRLLIVLIFKRFSGFSVVRF